MRDQVTDVRPDDVRVFDRPVVVVRRRGARGSPAGPRRSPVGSRARPRSGRLPRPGVRGCSAPCTSRSRSWSRAWAVMPSRPVRVSAASSAFTMAASVASTVALNSGVIRLSGTIRTSCVTGAATPGSSVVARPRLPVANARTMSPDEWFAVLPMRARPIVARWASRSHWWGRSGASVATMMMIEPGARLGAGVVDGVGPRVRARRLVDGDLEADRHPVDPQLVALAVVGLHQHADRPAAHARVHDPRRRPDAALELVAHHAGPAADVALGDRPVRGARRSRRRRARAGRGGRRCR